jgi:phospholipid/cholesterol/gamma-HCH transport system substrate-binding protein
MSSKQQTLLGLLTVAALAVLGFYTLFLTDVNLFGKSIQMVVQFPDANGLRDGDAVLVAGLRVGRVKSMTFDARADRDKRITVIINLDEDIPLFEDYSIVIEESTLLGGRNVSILPGQSAAPRLVITPGIALVGHVAPNPIDSFSSLAKLVDENRGSITGLLTNFAAVSDDLRAGRGLLGKLLTDDTLAETASQGVEDFAAMGADLRELSGRITAGEGTIGRLFSSDEMYDQVYATVTDLKDLAAGIKSGKGIAGKLFGDEELAQEVDRALRNFTSISDDLAAGKGTIGKFLKDDTAADNITAITSDIRDVTERVAAGEGTIGRLFASDELYQSLLNFSQRLDTMTAKLENGDGTLAKILNDDELYDEILTGVKLLNRSLEDYREAAPVSSFTSALFNIF